MKNTRMAEAYLKRADSCLEEARGSIGRKDYAGTVRRSQECVEFSLKGALRLYGVEYPREHDVKSILPKVASRFPAWFSRRAEELGKISGELARHRGPSMYGDEEKGIPPTELFGEEHARKALKDADFVHGQCRRLFSAFQKARRGRA